MNRADAVLFFKGRVALHAILEAAGVGPDDQVLMPGYTCVVVPNAVLYRGAEPVYVDIDPATCNLDPAALAAGEGTGWDPDRAKVLVVQHTYGLPAVMEPLREFARGHGLLLVEDACHALGSTYRGESVGRLGDAAFFSSQWSKPLTTGLGGWAMTRDPEFDTLLRRVASSYPAPAWRESALLDLQYLAYRLVYRPRLFWAVQGLYRQLGRLGLAIGSSTGAELDCREPRDYRKRMGARQAGRLQHLLAAADGVIARRRKNVRIIETELLKHGLPTATVPEGCDPVWLRYPVRVGNKEALLAAARQARVELGDWFLSPVHPNPDRWDAAAYGRGSCPEAERAAREIVNLPTHDRLDPAEIARIVAFVATQAEPATSDHNSV
ncbi:MAG: hypothetical protein GY838_08920 [bacterium]|nr:hypothetical protein [bacterium]